MSISTEISRIQSNKNTIRAKLVELGMATNTDNLDRLASAIEAIVDNGAINESIDGLTTAEYTIPAGYTSGGKVSLTSDIEEALNAI